MSRVGNFHFCGGRASERVLSREMFIHKQPWMCTSEAMNVRVLLAIVKYRTFTPYLKPEHARPSSVVMEKHRISFG